MSKIIAVGYTFEGGSFYRVGYNYHPLKSEKVTKIIEFEKQIGKGLHNNLTLNTYAIYVGEKCVVEIFAGYNLEVEYSKE